MSVNIWMRTKLADEDKVIWRGLINREGGRINVVRAVIRQFLLPYTFKLHSTKVSDTLSFSFFFFIVFATYGAFPPSFLPSSRFLLSHQLPKNLSTDSCPLPGG